MKEIFLAAFFRSHAAAAMEEVLPDEEALAAARRFLRAERLRAERLSRQ